jgi:predicted PurR-regulated permease PerM
MLATMFIVFVILGFWLLYRFRTVALALFVAVLIGTGINPAVSWLSRRGMPRLYANLLVYTAILAAVILFMLLVLPMVLEQSTQLTSQLNEYYFRFRTFLVTSRSQILTALGFRLAPVLEVENLVPDPAGEDPAPISGNEDTTAERVARLFRYAGMFGRGTFFTFAVILMAFYWTLEGDRALRTLLLLVPSSQREGARELFAAIESKLGGFLLGQVILCVIIGVMSYAAYLMIGLPNALVLAIIAGLMEAVPTVGPLLGALPAILMAVATDPTKVIWVIIATSVIQLLENNLLVPRVMNRSVGVHPLLTLLSLVALSSVMGILGALLAIPLAAIFQLLINRFLLDPLREPGSEPEGRDFVSLLRLRAQEIIKDTRKRSDARELDMEVGSRDEDESETLEDSIETLASDLEKILARPNGAEKEAA